MNKICEKIQFFPYIFSKRSKIIYSKKFYWSNTTKYFSVPWTFQISKRLVSQKISFIKYGESELIENEDISQSLKYKLDQAIIYNSNLENMTFNGPYHVKKSMVSSLVKEELETKYKTSVPVALQNLIGSKNIKKAKISEDINIEDDKNAISNTIFPHAQNVNVDDLILKDKTNLDWNKAETDEPIKLTVKEDVDLRLKSYYQRKRVKQLMASSSLIVSKDSSKEPSDKGNSSKVYSDTLVTDLSAEDTENAIKLPFFGTPNPAIPSSTVPCGGCGAVLHCQNQGVPGFMPSEIFSKKNKGELRSHLCQRCFFLKHYDMAINIKVSPELYERALLPIIKDKAAVIVVVDITDVPCSIWPGFYELLGSKRPVFVIGNKVDLLPADRTNPLPNILKSFVGVLKDSCLWQTNIVHIGLTSGKTGFGIEDLISKLQVAWGTKGNVYIVGCTNSGKSTLFNALLSSDLCQVESSDLIQRATASPWPGTTLNLLKFPIMRPTGSRIFRRMKRLKLEEKYDVDMVEKKKITRDYTEATLSGHIGQTFLHDYTPYEEFDSFRIRGNIANVSQIKAPHMGIKDDSNRYKQCKWLFDTPGTVQPDQMLGLLTHNELIKVLPKSIIEPRSFSLRGGHSLFVGGVARIDILYCQNDAIRFTVFASMDLPITIVKTVDASFIYRKYIGTDLFAVPYGPESRMKQWPALKPKNIKLINTDAQGVSCCDITLSSAGFAAVTGSLVKNIDLRVWTPGGRGVHVRSPAMLPLAVRLRGNRIKHTPAFLPHRVYVPDLQVKEN